MNETPTRPFREGSPYDVPCPACGAYAGQQAVKIVREMRDEWNAQLSRPFPQWHKNVGAALHETLDRFAAAGLITDPETEGKDT